MTPAQRHMGRVARIGCIVCSLMSLADDSPAVVHHIREGRIARNDYLTIPLCPPHHVGPRMSVHHDKESLLRAIGVHSEFDLLAEVLRRIER
jgi:hypothetical protein